MVENLKSIYNHRCDDMCLAVTVLSPVVQFPPCPSIVLSCIFKAMFDAIKLEQVQVSDEEFLQELEAEEVPYVKVMDLEKFPIGTMSRVRLEMTTNALGFRLSVPVIVLRFAFFLRCHSWATCKLACVWAGVRMQVQSLASLQLFMATN